LIVARNLLTSDGVIFISIDDNEVENLKKICNEVFGETNFKSHISWQKRYTRSNNTVDFTTVVEHILVYSKSEGFIVNLLPRTDDADNRYTNPDNDPRGPWKGASFLNPATPSQRPNLCYPITNPNTGEVTCNSDHAWRRSKDVFDQLQKENKLYWGIDGKSKVPSIKMFLSEARGLTPINFWDYEYAGNTDNGSAELYDLMQSKVFDFPKPVKLLRRILEHATDKDSLVLDFFSGSATTAHAVMQQNADDGGHRKFIMVQWPEKTPDDSEAAKAGYKNICEIGKERIRRAGKKIKEENPNAKDLDTGFRVFKCDESNYKDVAFSPKDYSQESLDLFVDNIKDGRSDLDLLFDCMLRWGVELSMPLKSTKVDGCTIHNVDEGNLVACFDGVVTEKVFDAIAAMSPVRVVFRDSSFTEAAAKMNLFELFKQKCTWSETEVKNNIRVI
jgi:adenine-specific DNA-methyltransferase